MIIKKYSNKILDQFKNLDNNAHSKINTVNVQHSLRNIPIPNRHEYMIGLLNKIETFLAKLRWKAHFTSQKYTSSDDDKIGDFLLKPGNAHQWLMNHPVLKRI